VTVGRLLAALLDVCSFARFTPTRLPPATLRRMATTFTQNSPLPVRRAHLARVQRRAVACSASNFSVAAALASLLAMPAVQLPDLYASTPETAAAVAALTVNTGGGNAAAWDGDWRVFHAPHLRSVDALGFRFRPVRYIISAGGTHIRSDVHWSAWGAAGWLCAEGRLAQRDGAVEVLFDSFWAAGESGEAPANPFAAGGTPSNWDSVVQSVGSAGFVASLSTFPVAFLDAEAGVTVFSFPPLRTLIAAARCA